MMGRSHHVKIQGRASSRGNDKCRGPSMETLLLAWVRSNEGLVLLDKESAGVGRSGPRQGSGWPWPEHIQPAGLSRSRAECPQHTEVKRRGWFNNRRNKRTKQKSIKQH